MSYVCARCIRERWLAEHIRTHADQNECEFCGRSSKTSFAIDLDDIIDHIRERIECIYEDPANSVGYDSAEGGYLLPTMDTYEVLDEVGLSVDNDVLRDRLADGVGHGLWVHRNPYSLEPEDAMQMSWQRFADTVKHKVRYLMFPVHEKDEYDRDERLEVSQVLDALGDAFITYDRISTLRAMTRLYRVRVHAPGQPPPNTIEALGPPPAELAKFSNRMNPAGMSMFYSAFDQATALAETYVRHDGKPAEATIAVFEVTEDLTVLDLTALPDYPSVFGSDQGNLERPTVHFLHSFQRDFVEPVVKDGREHVEYVPSQVVTEYVRYRLGDKVGKPIRGIVYPSARADAGRGCVLFVTYEEIARRFRADKTPFMLLASLTRTIRVNSKQQPKNKLRRKEK